MNLLFEHSSTPGTLYEDRLICDGGYGILNEMVIVKNLKESANEFKESKEKNTSSNSQLVKFRGKFQEADAINKNQRMYPFGVLDVNVKRLDEAIKTGGLIGEADHPADSIIHFSNCSHKITKLWWEGKTLMGEGLILDTPMGKLLKALINCGVRIGISSRGVGNGKVNEDGILVIGESYKLITFDAVADPSTTAAFQERVANNEDALQQNLESGAKNESSRIHNLSEELVLAVFSGILKEQTDQIKARLNS
jgi:hypothetical protein